MTIANLGSSPDGIARIVRAREWHPIKVTKIEADPLPAKVPQIVGGQEAWCSRYVHRIYSRDSYI